MKTFYFKGSIIDQTKKILHVVLCGFILTTGLVAQPCSDLFIAGYWDGPSNNKGLVVFNPSSSTIDLSSYKIAIYENGSVSPTYEVTLTGELRSKAVFAIGNLDGVFDEFFDQLSNDLIFNGNDAIVLQKISGGGYTTIDVLGEVGTDPGSSGWEVVNGSSHILTAGKALIRKKSISSGVPSWDEGKLEWLVYESTEFSDAMAHYENTCACQVISDHRTAWYMNHSLVYWDYQSDLFQFKTLNDSSYTSIYDTSLVDSIVYYPGSICGYNVVYFDADAGSNDINTVKNAIRTDSLFKFEIPIVTAYPDLKYIGKQWKFGSDLIRVTFKLNDPQQSLIDVIESKYNISVFHTPSSALPKSGDASWTYTFKMNPDCGTATTISIANRLTFELPDTIKFATPVIYNAPGTSSLTVDPYLAKQWWVENTGQCLGYLNIPAHSGGTSGADCNIDNAWTGYNGNGIKVEILENTTFDMGHEDMFFEYQWNYLSNSANVATNPLNLDDHQKFHGMGVAGLIGADKDNGKGIAGVAWGATIIPIISGLYTDAIQDAVVDNVDIINMSWSIVWDDNVQSDMLKAIVFGRDEKGLIFVASAGNGDPINQNAINMDLITDIRKRIFPATSLCVTGVMASTPDDVIQTKTAGFENFWESNYGEDFDLIAPGVQLISTDWSGAAGFSGINYPDFIYDRCSASNMSDNYTFFNGTSGSAPIVAGVYALLLQANPNLTRVQAQTILENTADKIGNVTYTNGTHPKYGHGRVNAYNAVMTALYEVNKDYFTAHIFPNPISSNEKLRISLAKLNEEKIQISVYDELGKKVLNLANLQAEQNHGIDINIGTLSSGFYMLNITSGDNSINVKLIVQ